MSQRVQRELTVINKLGLHARAAARLVTLAASFAADIRLARGDREVNGKSIMGVLMLAAGQGSRVELRAEGADAAEAVAEIQALFDNRFGEEA